MNDRHASTDEPVSEAIAATGLFLNIAAVIALAISLASWGASQSVIAATAGVAAALAFAGSLVCFAKQAQDQAAELTA